MPEAPPVTFVERLLRQFKSPLIYILLFALLLDLGLWVYEGRHGLPFDSIAIGVILALNAILGELQESKAEEALAHLKALALPHVWLIRDGTLKSHSVTEVVPGDIARIEAGDRVPADGRLAEGNGVLADESILTGESLPVDKVVGAEVSSGTLIVRGKGYIEVTRTGRASAMGRLATMIGGIEAGETPLERRLDVFGHQVAKAVLALSGLIIAAGIAAEGISHLSQVLLFAVALAVAAVPEGLPAILTLTLALGVESLSKRSAIIRRLSAVEALGSVTVIATDKTGTLTENRMHVREVDHVDGPLSLEAMVLANDAEVGTRAGDPLEIALLDYAQSKGIDAASVRQGRPRLSGLPFDSLYKYMRVTVQGPAGSVSYLKGAPEIILPRSAMSAAEKAHWQDKALAAGRQGYRVIALAWSEGEREDGVNFLGLTMLWDPPRAEVPEALDRAASAGIRVLMITGDHPATAQSVAEVIGIKAEKVLTGEDIEKLDARAVSAAVDEVNVFARVAPEHKLRLVETLKEKGEIVAVTGDGVNDAPALKRADVGVAMGQRGSDVSREVADIILMDDNFATIVAAIETGRSIYENIQKAIRLLFTANLAMVLLILAGLVIAFATGLKDADGGVFLPLTAAQLLWINVITDGPPALALALDRNPGLMQRPPRPPGAKLLDEPSIRFIAAAGAFQAVVGVLLFILMPRAGYSLDETRTAIFLYEASVELLLVYPARKLTNRPLPNMALHLAVGLGLALQASTLLVPGLRTLLQLTLIDAMEILAIIAGVVMSWAVAELAAARLRSPAGSSTH